MALTHVVGYRVVPGHEVEHQGFLRQSVLGAGLPAGAVGRCVAHRLGHGGPEYVVITRWLSEAAFEAGTRSDGLPLYLEPKADLLADCASALYRDVVVSETASAASRIVRLYRATIRRADREHWENSAGRSVAALAQRPGIRTIHTGEGQAGENGTISVVAITGWEDWASVIAATGGHLDRLLLDTELIDMEKAHSVEHYQVLEPEPGPESRRAEVAPMSLARAGDQQPDSSG